MPIDILMPALSPTMEKGNLAKWLKNEGDRVKAGDVLAEIETDKATMEVEAVDEGILGKILIPAGTADVPVNQLIAQLLEDGESAADLGKTKASPPATAAKNQEEIPTAVTPVQASTTHQNVPAGDRVLATPLAKRLAKEKGINVAQVKGSGPRGRIIAADILGAPKTNQTTTMSAPLASGPSSQAVKALYQEGSYLEIPHDSMRKVIAKRLLESKQTVPHFYLTADCELDALLALREQINAAAPLQEGKPAYKVSVNDFVIKAMAMALMRVPDANVSWTDDAMLKHAHADVGVAVAIPGGLITPVVRKAETKTLSAISNEMKDFAARARARKLKPEEYQGGSTAVSNLGMFGVKQFAAIINPPHATILAVGAGEKRPVIKNGSVVPATVMTVTLSTDHRAVDGALGAELLAAFRELIEKPAGMLA